MGPTEFASRDPLPDEARFAPRYPKPSRLNLDLRFPGEKAEKAGEKLGLTDVGALLDHIPRDRRAARTLAELTPDETATVVVEVRSITSRPVRRRGMKPLVEARVADETGTMPVTFFNQPWLERRYRPGTRLLLTGKLAAPPRRGFVVIEHAETGEQVTTGEDMATYPASDGLSSVQIAALAHEHRDTARDVLEPLPARLRVLERSRTAGRRWTRPTSATRRAAAGGWPSTSSCCCRSRCCAAGRRRESARAAALPPPGELTARYRADRCRSPRPAPAAAMAGSTRTSWAAGRCSGC